MQRLAFCSNLAAVVTALLAMTAIASWSNAAQAQTTVLPCPAAGVETELNAMFGGAGDPDYEEGDDAMVEYTLPVAIFPTGIPFAGMSYDTIFININGNITFTGPNFSYRPDAIPGLATPMIAPFFADVDLRDKDDGMGLVTPNPGLITVCEDAANDRIMVTWDTVVYYDAAMTPDGADFSRTATFQVILTNEGAICVDAGMDVPGVEVEFRYEALGWYVGQASGGTAEGICPATPDPMDPCLPASAGIDYGNMVTATALPGSHTPNVTSLLVTGTNVGMPGTYRHIITPNALPSCGNSTTDVCEACDDGADSTTCDADCTAVACGDAHVNAAAGEACDDGADTTSCDDDCTEVLCGDDHLNAVAGEECDDGNTDPDDGCSATCTIETDAGMPMTDGGMPMTDGAMPMADGGDLPMADGGDPPMADGGDLPMADGGDLPMADGGSTPGPDAGVVTPGVDAGTTGGGGGFRGSSSGSCSCRVPTAPSSGGNSHGAALLGLGMLGLLLWRRRR